MNEIAKKMLNKIEDKNIPVIERVKMLFWIEKYLWAVIDKALDGDE